MRKKKWRALNIFYNFFEEKNARPKHPVSSLTVRFCLVFLRKSAGKELERKKTYTQQQQEYIIISKRMQASKNSSVVQEQPVTHQELGMYAPSRPNDLALEENYNPPIPYILDIQQEDNISIEMIKLFQVI